MPPRGVKPSRTPPMRGQNAAPSQAIRAGLILAYAHVTPVAHGASGSLIQPPIGPRRPWMRAHCRIARSDGHRYRENTLTCSMMSRGTGPRIADCVQFGSGKWDEEDHEQGRI